MALLMLVAVAAALPAHAWPTTAFPLSVEVYGVPEGWSEADVDGVVNESAAAWALTCTGVQLAPSRVAAPPGFEGPIGGIGLVFGDPLDALEESTVAVVTVAPTGAEEERGGEPVVLIDSATVSLGDVDWISAAEGADPERASEGTSLTRAVTYLLGRTLGLSSACASGQCGDDEDTSVMHTELAPGEGPRSPNGFDHLALLSLYGERLDRHCIAVGGRPAVRCSMQGGVWQDPRWDFGDGSSAQGEEVEHDYADAGTYVVQLCASTPSCAEELCVDTSVTVRLAGDTPDEEEDDARDEAGPVTSTCATAEAPAGLLFAGFALAWGRRRVGAAARAGSRR